MTLPFYTSLWIVLIVWVGWFYWPR